MQLLSPCATERYSQAIANLKREKSSVMSALHVAQNTFGYIPMPICQLISEQFDVPMSEISGIVSFYGAFKLNPPGKINIDVCTGTACFVKGAGNIIQTLQRELQIGDNHLSPDGMFSLTSARCIGCCSLAPVLTVNGETHANVDQTKLNALLKSLKERSKA